MEPADTSRSDVEGQSFFNVAGGDLLPDDKLEWLVENRNKTETCMASRPSITGEKYTCFQRNKMDLLFPLAGSCESTTQYVTFNRYRNHFKTIHDKHLRVDHVDNDLFHVEYQLEMLAQKVGLNSDRAAIQMAYYQQRVWSEKSPSDAPEDVEMNEFQEVLDNKNEVDENKIENFGSENPEDPAAKMVEVEDKANKSFDSRSTEMNEDVGKSDGRQLSSMSYIWNFKSCCFKAFILSRPPLPYSSSC